MDINCLLELRSEPAKPTVSCGLMILFFDAWPRGWGRGWGKIKAFGAPNSESESFAG